MREEKRDPKARFRSLAKSQFLQNLADEFSLRSVFRCWQTGASHGYFGQESRRPEHTKVDHWRREGDFQVLESTIASGLKKII